MADCACPLHSPNPGTAVPLLFLDLDGTVRHGPDELGGRHVHGPGDVVVFPEAVTMMRRWKSGGGRIVAVSNQGGLALGYTTRQRVIATMAATAAACGNLFDQVAWCSHHPEAINPELARCWCRKPAPGLLITAAHTLAQMTGERYPAHMALMVGDLDCDAAAAAAANVDFQWAAEWRALAAPPAAAEPGEQAGEQAGGEHG